MAIVVNKFRFTVTDDTASDPTIDEEINFTDNSGDTYATIVKTLTAGDEDTWEEETATALMDLSVEAERAKYLVITTNYPIYVWFGRTPEVAAGSIDTAVSPETRIDRLLVLAGPVTTGSVLKIYAVNPSRADDTNLDAKVKITYVYE